MNALEGDFICLSEVSINVNKMFTLLLFVSFMFILAELLLTVYLFITFLYCNVVVACLLLYIFFCTIFLFIR